jgi:lipoprotein-anchoring transpeptidase ErfK/SrfK
VRLRPLVVGVAVVLAVALVTAIGRAAISNDELPPGGAAELERPSATLPKPVGGSTDFDPTAAIDGSRPRGTVVAAARGPRIAVHPRPGGRRYATLHARRADGRRLPLVFSVVRQRGPWVKAYLPTRPNLSTGWLRTRDVMLSATPYRIAVKLSAHRLVLYRAGKAVLRAPIATGRAVSPTPTGRYYLTDLLRPPDPAGFYGPYAFGLSAHSPVYTSFEGGDGQVGIHGTSRPEVLGTDVSHGCIRVDNATITRLARTVPLGTPVEISRS